MLGKDNEVYSDSIFDKRPEQLSVEEFVYLTNLTQKHMPTGSENAGIRRKE